MEGSGRDAERGGSRTVQSVERAFDLLELLSAAGGSLALSQLSARAGLPAPTIHRLARTLIARGYVRQDGSRRYTLGPRLVPLGDTAGRLVGLWARPLLDEVVEQVGETANLAVLEIDSVIYLAQVPSPHAMRMFTEVGRRVLPHCTGVGKALLATLEPEAVAALLRRTGMPARTERTLTDPEALQAELARIRQRGYGVDNGEQEVGVRCVAVAVPDSSLPVALSVSGPSGRLTAERVPEVGRLLVRTARELSRVLRAD